MRTSSSLSGVRAVLYRSDGADLPPDVESWLSEQSVTLSSIGLASAFGAGADEVINVELPADAVRLRMDAFLARSDRDLGVHPSTRLPGAGAIEAQIKRLLAIEDLFAVCYADLDHFKEFNDRYSYTQGDRVIRILAMILHDIVKGAAGEAGFVGHIGGDDFIFIISPTEVANVCGEIIATFDELIP